MIRSYLFVPGDRPDRFEKARSSGADAVVLDLEDAVAIRDKVAARAAVAAWLSPHRPVYVRVNGVSTDWSEGDLEAIDLPGLAGVVLPKSESQEQLRQVADGLPRGAELIALVETALGVWEARSLAEAPKVTRLAFGSVDFRLDSGIKSEDELGYARSRLVLASRVAGILPPVDGVTTEIEDAEALASDVARAVRQGFGGKLCVHPRQVKSVNIGFMPTEEEVAWAKRVLEASRASGAGAFEIAGELIDQPVIERARGIVALENSAGQPDQATEPSKGAKDGGRYRTEKG